MTKKKNNEKIVIYVGNEAIEINCKFLNKEKKNEKK